MDKKVKNKKRCNFGSYMKKNWILYLMLLPLIVYLLVFNYYPMLGLQLAFKNWHIRKGIWGSPWATDENGNLDLLFNFKRIFGTSEFGAKLWNTLRISFLKFLFGFPAPIILVLLMNELTSKPFMKFVQSVSYIPYFISWVVLGGIFLSIDSSDGFQNIMNSVFGHDVHFFSNGRLYLVFLVISDIFKNVGWGTIIYLAALNNISPELYEAAEIDGANRFQKVKHITLPGLSSVITINIVMTLSNIMYAGFDQIYNTYNDNLDEFGETLELYIFHLGVEGGDYALSTAIGLFNSLVGCLLVIIGNKVSKKLGGEGIW